MKAQKVSHVNKISIAKMVQLENSTAGQGVFTISCPQAFESMQLTEETEHQYFGGNSTLEPRKQEQRRLGWYSSNILSQGATQSIYDFVFRSCWKTLSSTEETKHYFSGYRILEMCKQKQRCLGWYSSNILSGTT